MTTLKKPVIVHRPAARVADTASGGVSSELLLGGKSELRIRHNGDTYSLRKTRLGKLILTK
ncbi:MAG: hemin uptake protein HemP [Betaproteobacteria bacterium]|nr:hemin uptake protein HemP [Betaproteobacteria bacterium]